MMVQATHLSDYIVSTKTSFKPLETPKQDHDDVKAKDEIALINALGLRAIPQYVFDRVPRDFQVFINGSDSLSIPRFSPPLPNDPEVKLLNEFLSRSSIESQRLNARITQVTPNTFLDSQSCSFSAILTDEEYLVYLRTHRLPIYLMSEVEIYLSSRWIYKVFYGDKYDYRILYFKYFHGFISNINVSGNAASRTIECTCKPLIAFCDQTLVPMGTDNVVGGVQAAYSNVNLLGAADPVNMQERIEAGYSTLKMDVLSTIIFYFHRAFRSMVLPASYSVEPGEMVRNKIDYEIMYNTQMTYWAKRFEQVSNQLKIFGLKTATIEQADDKASLDLKPMIDSAAFATLGNVPKGTNLLDCTYVKSSFDELLLCHFNPNWYQIAEGRFENFDNSSLSQLVKSLLEPFGWEFYQDVDGTFTIKPPFFNLISVFNDGKRGNLDYYFDSEDIVSLTYGQDESNIVTALGVQGRIKSMEDDGGHNPYGFYADPDLVARFGIRMKELQVPFVDSSAYARIYARTQMSVVNAASEVLSMSVLARPEIRPGFPCYIKPLDMYAYISGVSAPYQMNSSCLMSITLTALRPRLYDKSGNILFNARLTQQPASVEKAKEFIAQGDIQHAADYSVSTLGGQWELHSDTADFTAEDPYANINEKDFIMAKEPLADGSGALIPLTDKFGYMVIGSFSYGRGMYLSDKNELCWSLDGYAPEKVVQTESGSVEVQQVQEEAVAEEPASDPPVASPVEDRDKYGLLEDEYDKNGWKMLKNGQWVSNPRSGAIIRWSDGHTEVVP